MAHCSSKTYSINLAGPCLPSSPKPHLERHTECRWSTTPLALIKRNYRHNLGSLSNLSEQQAVSPLTYPPASVRVCLILVGLAKGLSSAANSSSQLKTAGSLGASQLPSAGGASIASYRTYYGGPEKSKPLPSPHNQGLAHQNSTEAPLKHATSGVQGPPTFHLLHLWFAFSLRVMSMPCIQQSMFSRSYIRCKLHRPLILLSQQICAVRLFSTAIECDSFSPSKI